MTSHELVTKIDAFILGVSDLSEKLQVIQQELDEAAHEIKLTAATWNKDMAFS